MNEGEPGKQIDLNQELETIRGSAVDSLRSAWEAVNRMVDVRLLLDKDNIGLPLSSEVMKDIYFYQRLRAQINGIAISLENNGAVKTRKMEEIRREEAFQKGTIELMALALRSVRNPKAMDDEGRKR